VIATQLTPGPLPRARPCPRAATRTAQAGGTPPLLHCLLVFRNVFQSPRSGLRAGVHGNRLGVRIAQLRSGRTTNANCSDTPLKSASFTRSPAVNRNAPRPHRSETSLRPLAVAAIGPSQSAGCRPPLVWHVTAATTPAGSGCPVWLFFYAPAVSFPSRVLSLPLLPLLPLCYQSPFSFFPFSRPRRSFLVSARLFLVPSASAHFCHSGARRGLVGTPLTAGDMCCSRQLPARSCGTGTAAKQSRSYTERGNRPTHYPKTQTTTAPKPQGKPQTLTG